MPPGLGSGRGGRELRRGRLREGQRLARGAAPLPAPGGPQAAPGASRGFVSGEVPGEAPGEAPVLCPRMIRGLEEGPGLFIWRSSWFSWGFITSGGNTPILRNRGLLIRGQHEVPENDPGFGGAPAIMQMIGGEFWGNAERSMLV